MTATEEAVKLYETSDKQMCIALMMPYSVAGTHKDEEDRLVYSFTLEDTKKVPIITDNGELVWRDLSCKEFIGLIRSGRSGQLLFTLSDLWNSENIWVMNLRHHDFRKK